MLKCILTEDEIIILKNIIDKHNNCDCNWNISFSTIWFQDDEVELRISFLQNIKLIISRVCFINKRNGTMSEILEKLKEICQKNHIKLICMQSVLTDEMINFCKKNDFLPDEYSSYEIDGKIFGDYILTLKEAI